MALNLKIIKPSNIYYDSKKIDKLCTVVRNNDINKKIITNHQKYIVNTNAIHSVAYYSLNGAFFLNRYLRNIYSLQNILLEKNITFLSNMIKESPAFDKEYNLYA